MAESAEVVAKEIVANQTGMCFCCDEKKSRWNCEKEWVRSIAQTLTTFVAQQVAQATRETWEEAAAVCEAWEDNRKQFALTRPADFGAKVMAAKLADAFRRRAQGETKV